MDIWWLDRFGLTPDQVDTLPAGTYARAMQIECVLGEVRKQKQEEANRG